MQVKVSLITLNYTCDSCKKSRYQTLEDIVEVGTLMCHGCGDEMRLDATVTIGEGYCSDCIVFEHDVCSLTDGCPCCDETKQLEAKAFEYMGSEAE